MRPKGASAADGAALHLYRQPSDTRSICGIPRPLPVVLARHAEAHVTGRGATLCPACAPRQPRAVDLFAGPGGWDTAAVALGIDVEGIEWDHAACETRRAAGLRTIEADISKLDPHTFAGVDGLIASPPCPAFSAAGKGEGREHLPALVAAVHRRDWACRPADDPKVWLGLEVGRWYEALRPDWVALEQVPAVLPLWEAYAHVLRVDGFSVWTGVLCAADYGVPQTRERAILIARRSGPAIPPPPTHAREPGVALFDQRLPWVTMADALGWSTEDRVGFPRLDDRGDSPDGYRERDWRNGDEPAFTVTEKARSWIVRTGQYSTLAGSTREEYTRPVDEPAPTLTGMSHRQWVMERPATTVQCDPRLGNPGHRDRAGGERQFQPDAIRLTIRDALILQSFPPDYPVQGTKTKQFEQVGNAIPPLLARAVLGQLVDPPEAM